MASFSVPCPKTSALIAALQPNSKQNQKHRNTSILFRSDLKSSGALVSGFSLDNSTFLGFQESSRNQNDVFRVCAQLNEVVLEKSSNSLPAPETKSEASSETSDCEKTIPDASSLTAFMNQVTDLIELVDSTDIMELQLKQLDCEVLIRKKEALPQPPAAPLFMMQSPSPQAMVPPSLQLPPPAQVAAPSGSVPSLPAPSAPAKPKSSHPPLKCPMAGTFYRCPAPGAPPFVKVGDKVQKGQVVCIIEAMKLMNEIEADKSGTIVDFLVDDRKPVSVDLPLLVIEP